MHKPVSRFDKWLHSHILVLLALLAIIILRLPNFFEPYWYGDEGIYLTVGNGLKSGERLYADIIDHKTPIIYYLATVPSQLDFRLLNLIWMLVTTVAFYGLLKKLLSKTWSQAVALFLFVALTTLPWFEGNIPNGELFVMGFVLVGGWILSQTQLFDLFLNKRKSLARVSQPGKLFAAGVLMGLAILTKIPAVLDLGAFILIGWFALSNHLTKKNARQLLTNIPIQLLVLGIGVLAPILISIVYFVSIGAGQEFLDFGLMYNFRYAATWDLPFQNQLLQILFTLQGKILVAGGIIVGITAWRKKFSPVEQFAIAWFLLALIGSLLSNRPYPHYFQQLVPPLSLLVGLIVQQLPKLQKHGVAVLTETGIIGMFGAALLLLGFAPYPTYSYYHQFYRMITHQISLEEYRNSFNYLMADNYAAAQIINKSGVDEIFIWGTNPMLYALTETNPTGRFTVSFHIKDFDAYDETFEDLQAAEPLFIVIMKEETTPLPGLQQYVNDEYVQNANFTHFTLWKRLSPLSTAL